MYYYKLSLVMARVINFDTHFGGCFEFVFIMADGQFRCKLSVLLYVFFIIDEVDIF